MRFKEFLAEDSGQGFTIGSFDDAISSIKRDCKQYLIESKGQMLYRGMGRKLSTEARYSPHPEDRRPKDSTNHLNFMFNAACELAFGVEDIRTKTIFATSDNEDAHFYGDIHYFFPSGNYKYLWSSKISDSGVSEGENKMLDILAKKLSSNGFTLDPLDFKGGFLKSYALTKSPSEWIEKIQQGNTRTIASTAKYFGLLGSKVDMEFPHLLLKSLTETFQDLYDNSKHFKTAAGSGNEIMFYETDGYYSIPSDLVGQTIQERGGRLDDRWDFGTLDKFVKESLTA